MNCYLLFICNAGVFFSFSFFSHITKNRNPPPLHWPPHTFSFFFFFPRSPAAMYYYLFPFFVFLFRNTQLPPPPPPPPGHAISHPSFFLSFVNFIISKRHGNSFRRDPRLFHDGMPKREKTKTFINNPSFRMTFFLYDCLRFGVCVILSIAHSSYNLFQLVFFCVLYFSDSDFIRLDDRSTLTFLALLGSLAGISNCHD